MILKVFLCTFILPAECVNQSAAMQQVRYNLNTYTHYSRKSDDFAGKKAKLHHWCLGRERSDL